VALERVAALVGAEKRPQSRADGVQALRIKQVFDDRVAVAAQAFEMTGVHGETLLVLAT